MLDALKLVGVLVLIVGLLRLKWNLALILLLASAAAGLLFGVAPKALAVEALKAAIAVDTVRLVAIVLLIMLMGEILRSTLQLNGLVRSLGDLVTDARWLLASIPLLIGLLPMIGGAMFSAPMVEEASQALVISPERKTFANYWFRHVCEAGLPLYPSMVLAAGLMGLSAQALAASNWPLLVAALAVGVVLGCLRVPRASDGRQDRPAAKGTWRLLLRSVWPIAGVLVLAMALGIDLVVSLVLTVVALVALHRLTPRRLWTLVKSTQLSLLPVIVSVMIFQRILSTSGAVEATSGYLANLGIPVPVVVFAVPLLASLLTGLAVSGFAIGLPIVLPLCPPDLVGSGYSTLAYTGGFCGLLLSPVHLCLILSREYFKATWGGIYRFLLPATLVLVLTCVAVFLVRSQG